MKLSSEAASRVGPGILRSQKVRLGKTYADYLRWVSGNRNPETMVPLSHVEWVKAMRSAFASRMAHQQTQSSDLEARRELTREAQNKGATYGLGYVATWKEIAKKSRPRSPRSQVEFVKTGVVRASLEEAGLVPGLNFFGSEADYLQSVADYRAREYFYRFEVTWKESMPVAFFRGFTVMGERLINRTCLTCGGHRLDGLFCCMRFISKQLTLISLAVQELRGFGPSSTSLKIFKMLHSEASRLHLQRHRIIWHYSLMCMPYATKFNRIFGVTQDMARLAMAAQGEDVFKKVTRGTVVKELAELTKPSAMEVTEQLFGIERPHALRGGWSCWHKWVPYHNEALVHAMYAYGEVNGYESLAEAYADYLLISLPNSEKVALKASFEKGKGERFARFGIEITKVGPYPDDLCVKYTTDLGWGLLKAMGLDDEWPIKKTFFENYLMWSIYPATSYKKDDYLERRGQSVHDENQSTEKEIRLTDNGSVAIKSSPRGGVGLFKGQVSVSGSDSAFNLW